MRLWTIAGTRGMWAKAIAYVEIIWRFGVRRDEGRTAPETQRLLGLGLHRR